MATLSIRIEEKTKKVASKVLRDVGLDLSSGIKIFLHQVALEQGLPFTPTKNKKAIAAKWDKEVANALKRGTVYDARDALKGL